MYLYDSDVVLRDCKFIGNYGPHGGGAIYVEKSAVTEEQVHYDQNDALYGHNIGYPGKRLNALQPSWNMKSGQPTTNIEFELMDEIGNIVRSENSTMMTIYAPDNVEIVGDIKNK